MCKKKIVSEISYFMLTIYITKQQDNNLKLMILYILFIYQISFKWKLKPMNYLFTFNIDFNVL